MYFFNSIMYSGISLIVLWFFFTMIFLLAWKLNLWKIIDIAWGMGFICVIIVGMILNFPLQVPLILPILVILWGIRLSGQLIYRMYNSKGEDKRYAKLKESNQSIKQGYINIFLLQALLVWIMCIPFYFYFSLDIVTWGNIYFYIGVGVSIFALLYEMIADIQMTIFKKPNQLVKDGLWRYSRHPNYFGEICFWWGIWISIASILPLFMGIIGIVSPLLITYIITFVTGPMLEEQMNRYPEWEEYKGKTPYIIPKKSIS